MPKQKPVAIEDLIIPPQDTRICGTICICAMTAVLSSVALVYLTVAIYVPSTRAFQSGITEVPVMCQTTRAVTKETCDWGSCGEWCLSKTSGACMQIFVSLRRNGSSVLLANCTNTANKTCYGIDQENAKKSRCIADECKNLTGTFNCTTGTCINITDAFECIFKDTDMPLKCSGRRGKITCIDLDGLFNCNRGTCEKIKSPYNCDRRCVDIPTRNKNIIMLSGDKVYLSQCQRAIDMETGEEVWNEEQDNIMMASCYSIVNTSIGVVALDCINGSLLPNNILSDLTNFTYLSYLSVFNTQLLDEKRRTAPPEMDLLISNESKLLINLEGCVNTLQDECKEFLREYGRDGTDHNARARFPCFYAEANTELVVARGVQVITRLEKNPFLLITSLTGEAETPLWLSEINHAFPSWSEVLSITQELRCTAIDFYEHFTQELKISFKIDSDESTVIMGAEVGTSIERGSSDSLSAPKVEVLSKREYFLNLLETAKFYTSLCLGTTAFISVFAFLFLIPFVVDPAITTILADYDPQAVTCLATEHIYAEGLRNCSWSSCREGCTNAAIRCHQILVNYSKIPFREWIPTDPSDVKWDMADTKFMVNSEGCGYPPRVNCNEFSKQYGYGSIGTPFPCYYSRTYPENVIARYNWEENLRQLILSLIIPNVLFAVSIGLLSYWYCPGCGRACNKVYMEKFPIKVDDDEPDDDAY